MNILMLNWRGPGHPNNGGAEIAMMEHLKAWEKKGHTVWLFTSQYTNSAQEETIDGIRIVRHGGMVLGVHLRAFLWYLFGKHPRFDVVIDQIHGVPFFTPLYVRVKRLAYIHEVAKEVWWMNPWPAPFHIIPGILGSTFERYILSILYRNTPFMTVSNSTKVDLVEWGIPQQNIHVIQNGISVLKLTQITKEKIPTFIYLGAVSKDKGIFEVLHSFSIIKKQLHSCKLWIIGKSDVNTKNEVLRLSKNLEISKDITLFGFVSEKKKYELLSKGHVLLNASIREGWGLVNIEANACGLPVVGYNSPGIRDSVINNKTGILTDTNSVSMSEAVIHLVEDKKLYRSLSMKARDWARNFTWKRSTDQSVHLLQSL